MTDYPPQPTPKGTEEQQLAYVRVLRESIERFVTTASAQLGEALKVIVESVNERSAVTPEQIERIANRPQQHHVTATVPQKSLDDLVDRLSKAIDVPDSVSIHEKDLKRIENAARPRATEKIDFRSAMDSLIADMRENPKVYLNARITNGKEFVEAINRASEVISVAGGKFDKTGLASEGTLSNVKTILDTTLVTTSGILAALGGTLTVDTGLSPQTDALTNAELRAADVKVSLDSEPVIARHSTDTIQNGAVALTPKFASINRTSTGEVIAAVSGKKIRVLALQFTCATDGTVKWSGNSGGTELTGEMTMKDGSGLVLPFNPVGWFETGSGHNLYVTLASVSMIDGSLTYVEV